MVDEHAVERERLARFWDVLSEVNASTEWVPTLPWEWLARVRGAAPPPEPSAVSGLDALVARADDLPKVERGDQLRRHTDALVLASQAEMAWFRAAGYDADTCLVGWIVSILVLARVGIAFPIAKHYQQRGRSHTAAHEKWTAECLAMSPADEATGWDKVLELWPQGIGRLHLNEPFSSNEALARYIGGQVVRAQRRHAEGR